MNECLFWGQFWFENCIQKRALVQPEGGCTPPAPSPWIRPCKWYLVRVLVTTLRDQGFKYVHGPVILGNSLRLIACRLDET
jgi:hypothetical protein